MSVKFKEGEIPNPFASTTGGAKTMHVSANVANTRDSAQNIILQRLSLNRFDRKFMSDIQVKYLVRNRPLSEGQNELYEKIIYKYRKQFKKHCGIHYAELLELPWCNKPRTKEELLEQTYFKFDLDENGAVTMHVRFPFNKDVIDEMRAIVHDDERAFLKKNAMPGESVKYDFVWSNEEREWHGKFNLYLFKPLLRFARKNKLKIDHNVLEFAEELDTQFGDADEWAIRLVESNGNIYVNNINEFVYNALNDYMPPKEMNLLQTEAVCRNLGIEPPDSIDPLIRELMMQNKFNDHDQYRIVTPEENMALEKYLDEIGATALFYLPGINHSNLQEKDLDAFVKSLGRHTFVHTLDSQAAQQIVEGDFDTLVSAVSFSSVLAAGRQFAPAAKGLKKFIQINYTQDDSNPNN